MQKAKKGEFGQKIRFSVEGKIEKIEKYIYIFSIWLKPNAKNVFVQTFDQMLSFFLKSSP